MDVRLSKIIDIVQRTLEGNESIVGLSIAEPLSASHADYFVRYKVKLGKVNSSATAVDGVRCLVVQFSSNNQSASISYDIQCSTIADIEI